jgi:hypothetical protein
MVSNEYDAFLRDQAYWKAIDELNQFQAQFIDSPVTDAMSKRSKEKVNELIEILLKERGQQNG